MVKMLLHWIHWFPFYIYILYFKATPEDLIMDWLFIMSSCRYSVIPLSRPWKISNNSKFPFTTFSVFFFDHNYNSNIDIDCSLIYTVCLSFLKESSVLSVESAESCRLASVHIFLSFFPNKIFFLCIFVLYHLSVSASYSVICCQKWVLYFLFG